jgi:hypothetical protein
MLNLKDAQVLCCMALSAVHNHDWRLLCPPVVPLLQSDFLL